MRPKLYFDEHINIVVAEILRSRQWDVLTTRDAGNSGLPDDTQLDFAASVGRCLVTSNIKHFVPIQTRWLREGLRHAGILCLVHDPRPSVMATKILRRLGSETAESIAGQLIFG